MSVSLFWALLMSVLPFRVVTSQVTPPVRPSVQPQPDTVSEEGQLLAITQKLLNAVAAGDTATWNRYLLDDCIMTDAEGVSRTKVQLLNMMHPLPSGYNGTLRIEHPLVRIHGATAVVAYSALQVEDVYGQTLTTRYQMTDTYVRTPSGWQVLSSQSFVIPQEPVPVKVDSAVLSVYVGRYALSPAVVYDVVQDDGKLFGQWPEGPKEELLPLGPATFFRSGVRGVRLFERDAAGKVARMIDRRDGNDLVWTRVPQ